jgi:hypothetical protein
MNSATRALSTRRTAWRRWHTHCEKNARNTRGSRQLCAARSRAPSGSVCTCRDMMSEVPCSAGQCAEMTLLGMARCVSPSMGSRPDARSRQNYVQLRAWPTSRNPCKKPKNRTQQDRTAHSSLLYIGSLCRALHSDPLPTFVRSPSSHLRATR